jgi:hypothetical protein
MSKRAKMAITSFLLTLAILAIQSVDVDTRYQAIGLLAGAAYGLSAWALWQDLRGVEWLMVFIIPVI